MKNPKSVIEKAFGWKKEPSNTSAANIARFFNHCLGLEETKSQNGTQIIFGPLLVNSYLAIKCHQVLL